MERPTPARLGEVSCTWQALLEAVERWVEDCRPGELAELDAVRLENAAKDIRIRMEK